ncbi:hypothetical protein F5Y03DRAFT_391570 [Xylaria venustula]|nr:hypothetical protein F5Y03DRAFT_391570 [Xylaria venustula]
MAQYEPLTVETSAAIVRPLKSSDAVVTASADGDDKFAKVAALMMGDTQAPETQVADGQVPKAPPVVVLPGYSNTDVANNYGTLIDATAMCQLYVNLMQVQQKPDGFNITSEAGAAYNFQANMAGLATVQFRCWPEERPQLNVTGSDSDPIYVYQPTTFLIYMKIDARTFFQSTSKKGGEDRVNLKFTMTTTRCELNTRKFEQNRAKFDEMFMLVTNNNMRAYSELLNKQVQSNEPNPGKK